MKYLLVLAVAVFSLTLSSCSKDDSDPDYESSGIIVGPDLAFCPCCGGWILTIDDEEGNFRFDTLPADANIDLSQTDIPVLFDWNIDRECGGITYVNIEAIELQ